MSGKKIGLLQQSLRKRFSDPFSTASSASLLDDQVINLVSNARNTIAIDQRCEEKNPTISRSQSLFPVAVRVLRSLSWEAVQELSFSEMVEKHGLSHSVDVFSLIVHIFASARMRVEVHWLLRQVVDYYKSCENFDAFGLLGDIFERSNDLQGYSIVSQVLIKVFAESSLIEESIDTFYWAKKVGLQLTVSSCNFLLKCLVERNKADELRSLIHEMKSSGPLPNVYTYTILMNFYCREDMGHATQILSEMQRNGINPSVVTYGIYINGLCNDGDIESALKLLRELRDKGFPLNNYCYNAVICGLCRRSTLHDAMTVLDEMKNCGLSPDVHTYSILIDGFCKAGNIDAGLNLLEEMGRDRIQCNIVCWSALINGLCKNWGMKSASEMFHKVVNFGLKHDNTSYNILINGYCKCGDLDAACRTLEEMDGNGLFPDVFDYTCLIWGYCRIGCLKEALEIFINMQDRGIYPNVVTCTIIVHGYCKAGSVSEAFKLMDDMLNQGFREIGEMDKAYEMYDKMVEFGIFPDAITLAALGRGETVYETH